jgi:hypothetical protein
VTTIFAQPVAGFIASLTDPSQLRDIAEPLAKKSPLVRA